MPHLSLGSTSGIASAPPSPKRPTPPPPGVSDLRRPAEVFFCDRPPEGLLEAPPAPLDPPLASFLPPVAAMAAAAAASSSLRCSRARSTSRCFSSRRKARCASMPARIASRFFRRCVASRILAVERMKRTTSLCKDSGAPSIRGTSRRVKEEARKASTRTLLSCTRRATFRPNATRRRLRSRWAVPKAVKPPLSSASFAGASSAFNEAIASVSSAACRCRRALRSLGLSCVELLLLL